MGLFIEHQDNTFYLKGELNQANSDKIQQQIEGFFKRFATVVLNINEVQAIDSTGVGMLKQLYVKSQQEALNFAIVGVGCKDIYEEFLN